MNTIHTDVLTRLVGVFAIWSVIAGAVMVIGIN